MNDGFEEEQEIPGFEEVDGHIFPSAQCRYIRALLDNPNPTLERAVDHFLASVESKKHGRFAPTLLLHWFYLIRAMVPFHENMLSSAELHFCIALANRCDFSLKEILIMTSLIGSGKGSHQTASEALDTVVLLIKREAELDGIEIVSNKDK